MPQAIYQNYRLESTDAGWSSPVARQAHNLKVVGSNPTPATRFTWIAVFLLTADLSLTGQLPS